MVSMKVCNFMVVAAGMVVGGSIMRAAARFPMDVTGQGPGPGFWPFLLGLALVLAAVSLVFYTVWHRHELEKEKVVLGTAANRQVYAIMLLIAVFCALVSLVGFYPAAISLIPCIMYRLGCRDRKQMLLTAFCVTVFIYLVFGQLLHTSLPSSVFLE